VQQFTTLPACTQTLSAGANVKTAVETAPAGAVICLSPGTYTSPGTSNVAAIGSTNGTASAPVTLTSSNPAAPATLKGRFTTLNAAKYLTVSHLRFVWDPVAENDTIALTGQNITLSRNDISGSSDTICVNTLGWNGVNATSITVDRNLIHHCGDTSNADDRIHAQGVYAGPGTVQLRVTNNWCYRVAARCYMESGGTGDQWTHNTADFENWGYLFGESHPTNDVMSSNVSGPDHYRYNNTVGTYDYGGDLAFFTPMGTSGDSFTNNCWQGVQNGSSSGTTVSGNTVQTVQFTNAAADDYHLTSTSPCQGYGPTGSTPGP
jgi:hypothetical protein